MKYFSKCYAEQIAYLPVLNQSISHLLLKNTVVCFFLVCFHESRLFEMILPVLGWLLERKERIDLILVTFCPGTLWESEKSKGNKYMIMYTNTMRAACDNELYFIYIW